MREVSPEDAISRSGRGLVPTSFATRGPKNVPRVDYDRIFVLDDQAKLLGEYAFRDDCPLEYEDLLRAIPLNGMRHLSCLYQGEYTFTPFRVDDLWFVILTRGVPRIEDRASIGTLLAAMRAHLPPTLAPSLAAQEATLRQHERDMERREALVTWREERVSRLETDLQVAGKKMTQLEADVRARETRLNALRDYAIQMQRSIRTDSPKPQSANQSERNPSPDVSVSPPP